MAFDLNQIWKDLGLHHNQAKKLATIGLSPAKAGEMTVEEMVEKYGVKEALAQRITGVLLSADGLAAIEKTKKDMKAEPPAEPVFPVDEPTQTKGKPERVTPPPRKKSKAKAKVKAKPVKSDAKITTLDMSNVRSMNAKDKLKLIMSKAAKEYKDAGLIGVASQMESLITSYISTGFTALDVAMGGGWPVGKYSVIYGPSQTCKSTICLYTIAKDMRENPNSYWLWINAENSLDREWAEHIGVDTKRLLVIEPMEMEEQIDRAIEMIETGAVTGAVVDSAGVWLPWQEVKKKRTDTTFTKKTSEDTVALLARVIGKFIRKTTALSARTLTSWLIISHEYAPIGPGAEYMPQQLKGGNALKYAGHIRIYTSRRKGDKAAQHEVTMPDGRKKKIYVAFEAGFKVDKTRQSATETHQVFIPFIHGVGLSEMESIIEMALGYEIIQKKGNYYWHPAFGTAEGCWVLGKEKTIQHIRDNQTIYEGVLESVGQFLADRGELGREEDINAVTGDPEYRDEPE